MNGLDRLVPTPRLLEVDHVDLAIQPERAWALLRHADLGGSPFIRALFAIRTVHAERAKLRIDDLVSTPERPGFAVLLDEAPHEVVVGAIGKVWKLDIRFVHVGDAAAFEHFDTPDFVKVAWAIQVAPLGEASTRVTIEVRVDATSEVAWRKFRHYFRLIGPGSHFIRRSLLGALARELGTPEAKEHDRKLPGDERLVDATEQVTDGVTIEAKPEDIWPWLVQMGCRRAGFYSFDAIDNANVRSAREIHPELQQLRAGDLLPATPDGVAGFEVLRVEPNRLLALGGLYDVEGDVQRAFDAERPRHFWQTTWTFVLEPLDERTTRLHVRGRAAFSHDARLRAWWMRLVHHFMERAQLRHLKARVEGRVALDDWRDVSAGVGGAAIMLAAMLTPFMRRARSHWGVDEKIAARHHPGDELVPSPRWSWTHGIEIEAPAPDVWPWVAQIGAGRGGFYSYQWLENLVGCHVRSAEVIHPEWAVKAGDTLSLHPKMPPLDVISCEPGRHFVVYAGDAAGERGAKWTAVSWLFFLEPLGERRCRLISRYRCASSDDVATRLQFGPALLEPIGFAMDRRMLLGVRERVMSVPVTGAARGV